MQFFRITWKASSCFHIVPIKLYLTSHCYWILFTFSTVKTRKMDRYFLRIIYELFHSLVPLEWCPSVFNVTRFSFNEGKANYAYCDQQTQNDRYSVTIKSVCYFLQRIWFLMFLSWINFLFWKLAGKVF